MGSDYGIHHNAKKIGRIMLLISTEPLDSWVGIPPSTEKDDQHLVPAMLPIFVDAQFHRTQEAGLSILYLALPAM